METVFCYKNIIIVERSEYKDFIANLYSFVIINVHVKYMYTYISITILLFISNNILNYSFLDIYKFF